MSSDDDEDRAPRARARASWPSGKLRLGHEPDDDFSALTMEQRIAMVAELTEDAWAGRALPDYERSNMPGKVVRRPAAARDKDLVDVQQLERQKTRRET